MIINKKDKFQEVFPSAGLFLFLDGEIFEGVCCPLDVTPSKIYTEITKEEADALMIDDNTEEEEDGNNNWTNN